MGRFISGADRKQTTLFPPCVDDWIGDDNPVRVIDIFVDTLDLLGLGFDRTQPAPTGRPAYHPSVLLKLYIYGYLNRVQSSRRLEREADRNVELMWLVGRLVPDHKTIADFRRDNGTAIRQVCGRFVLLCREMALLTSGSVAIDGSKFKAVNNRDRNFTKAKLARRREQIEESVARYLAQLDTADRQEPTDALASKTDRLKEKIARLEEEMKRLDGLEEQMLAAPDQQISLTDPDARSMATSGRGTGMVGYNVQVAVDTEHHIIVAHEVTNIGSDRAQLSGMATTTKAVLGEQDVYRCPAGELLKNRLQSEERGLKINRYWASTCQTCAIKSRCTPGKERRVSRWEHEDMIEAMQHRLDANPDAMRIRRQTVEHPFGTLKSRMGYTHFLTRTKPRVSTEMALHVLAYNLTRALNIMGTRNLLNAIAG